VALHLDLVAGQLLDLCFRGVSVASQTAAGAVPWMSVESVAAGCCFFFFLDPSMLSFASIANPNRW